MSVFGKLAATAVAGLLVTGSVALSQEGGTVKCAQHNKCKGKGGCKGDKNECKGQNSCKNHVFNAKDEAECKAAGGKVKH